MRFQPLPLNGAWILDLEKREDNRGFFARTFCTGEFQRQGLETAFVQANVSFSVQKGTLRGMHFQRPPCAEVKLVRCIRGSLFDVIVDLRAGSPTLGQWHGELLSAENRRSLYVPKGFAHGYLTLEDATEIEYLVSAPYSPQQEAGVRWNDPAFGIQWPFTPEIVSPKDAAHPDFSEQLHAISNPL